MNDNDKRKCPTPSTRYGGDQPSIRSLRVFSFDPNASKELNTALINEVTIDVPWSDLIGPGPVGEFVEVIDYDPPSECYYRPIDLNHPNVLATDGLDPSEANPQFHQQMVYAVVMATIGHFEQALGRAVLWSRRIERDENGDFIRESFVRQLRIYPHAFRGANAYYSPAKKALLFGYFTAGGKSPEEVVPGSTVFTCLSHDIIVHETAHAILDGMHPRFADSTNPDVLALHEAFADIVALFQHFSFSKVLGHQIAATRGDLSTKSLLVDLARQFGLATGMRGALRSAIGTEPNPAILRSTKKVHKRGAILVAAVFDAFLAIYEMRTRDLIRLATQGSGIIADGQLAPDLVARLSVEAADTAKHILHMCIRAMDYVPPVDVTFGDFLRALITSDFDLQVEGHSHYRTAFLEAFRQRGISPKGLRSVSIESLLWSAPSNIDKRGDSLPRIEFTLERNSKEQQAEANNMLAHSQQLSQVHAELQQVLAEENKIDNQWLAQMVTDANTPFVSLNKRIETGGLLQTVMLDSLASGKPRPTMPPATANFNLEWGVEGDRETKDFINQKNCEQFYVTFINHWARTNPYWAERELDLILYAASHRTKASDAFTVKDLYRSIYYSKGADPKALPSSIPAVEVHSFRVARRRGPRGSFLTELVVEVTQRRRGYFKKKDQEIIDTPDSKSGASVSDEIQRRDFTLRGGCTLIIDPRELDNDRFGIRRVIKNGSILDAERLERHRRFISQGDGSLRASYFGMPNTEQDEEEFAIIHSSEDS